MATATKTKPTSSSRQVIEELKKSLQMELETVINYLAAGINPNGVLAEEIKESLVQEVGEELGHARQLGRRIKQLGGLVPSAKELEFGDAELSGGECRDIESVVRGVIADENAAIEQYRRIIGLSDNQDPVTQDLCTKLLADEEEHRTQFEEFLVEFTND